ncbi:MAG: response regulator [Planctomycetaceae bacterium]|nr:response regulator [Planctomycetaceae bacterium]
MAATSSRRKPVPLTANRILVIDDDPLITKILERGLEQRGYTVSIARHGKDASFLALEFRPHLVILDVMLPDIDGEEICKRIRAHPETKNVRVISISAIGDPAKIQAMRNAGIDHFMPKPFSIQEVAAKIQELVGPIRAAEEKPQTVRRYKLIVAAAAICVALAVGGIILINNLFLKDIPPEMEPLAEFAGLFSGSDANSDGIITPAELDDAERFQSFDRDKDGLITPADGRETFLALSHGEAYPRSRWIDLGGDELAFDVLDRDKNGILNEADFAHTVKSGQEPAAQDIVTVKDPHTGRELVLDPLQKIWFDAVTELDQRGYVLWRDTKLPRLQVATSVWGRIKGPDGTPVVEGFVKEQPDRKEWRVFDDKGAQSAVPFEGNVFAPLPDAPQTQWHAKYFALKPDNAQGWANFAQELARHPEMKAEAREAAKRALIYDRTLEMLYAMLNVELQRGRLVEKAKAGQ